jgi:PPOX class probable F420-dependent enzyme
LYAGSSVFNGDMQLNGSDLEALRQFGATNTRSVLVTHRKNGELQSSPMSCVVDEAGDVLTATRASNAKVANLERDPRATLCLFDERWPGPWAHVDGQAQITRLPEAMPLLASYYNMRGQDTTTAAFRERMERENRVLIRVKVTHVARPRSA